MKKRSMAAMWIVWSLLLGICACGQPKEDGTGQTAPGVTSGETQGQAAEASGAAETLEIRLAHSNAANQPIHEACESWAQKVSDASGGRIVITVYPSAQLGTLAETQEAVQLGTLELAIADTSLLSSIVPQYGLFSLPFLIDGYESADAIVNGSIGEGIDNLAKEQGMVPLGWTWNGFRNFCTTTAITSVADCSGMKLRSPEAQIYLDTFNALGMKPTPLPWSEAFSAMQSGIVDGVESTLEAFYTQSFYTLGENICLSRHMISVIGPIANAKWWDSLDEADQTILEDAWGEVMAELNETVIGNEDAYARQLREANANITEFADRQEIIDLYTDYWKETADTNGYAKELEQAMALVQ